MCGKRSAFVFTLEVDPSSTLDGPPCLPPFLSYPLLAASEQPATTHCFYAAFGENTSGNVEQCTSHQRAHRQLAARAFGANTLSLLLETAQSGSHS
ncbi:hypothetical protein PoB_000847100 [Plakobranchus ocellatus]|uniref:Uncharacterized protein n=1 Tax=Plakobranchus ocellatus TaxID=259542 RepID=A0AAV3Y3Z4_9GAST|nr:hypothetical protein PoB_000847100 [Plakobranchus ocellatus]